MNRANRKKQKEDEQEVKSLTQQLRELEQEYAEKEVLSWEQKD